MFAIFDKDVNGEVKSADICGMALRGKCELASHRLNDWRLNIPGKPTVTSHHLSDKHFEGTTFWFTLLSDV